MALIARLLPILIRVLDISLTIYRWVLPPFLSRWWFSTICFSTVSPSPLTAEAPHQSPGGSSP